MAAPINGSGTKARRIFGPAKYWVDDRADLRADRRAGVHDERDQNIDVAFDRVRECSVARRDDDLEQIGADGEMCWNSQDVNHRRHADVAGAAAEKAAEKSADKRNEQNDPKRNRFHARDRQRNHRPDFYSLDRRWSKCLKAESSFFLLFRPRFAASFCASDVARPSQIMKPEMLDVNDDRDHAHDVIDVARAFQDAG